MGFCILNNVAVAAASLAARGERVLVVDYDAHHGNGTQDIFYGDAAVMYVSFHEWPLYPGTGALTETGTGEGLGTTVNFPLPAGATGDVYLQAIDDRAGPARRGLRPDVAGRLGGLRRPPRDPITGLGLSAGDYGAITQRLLEFAPRRASAAHARGRLRPPGAWPTRTAARAGVARGPPAPPRGAHQGRPRAPGGRRGAPPVAGSGAGVSPSRRVRAAVATVPSSADGPRRASNRSWPRSCPWPNASGRPATGSTSWVASCGTCCSIERSRRHRPHHRRPARRRSRRCSPGWADRRVDPGGEVRHDRRQAG